MTRLTPSAFRESSKPVMPAGLPSGTMMLRVLVANSCGSPTSPWLTALSMMSVSAVARTSAAEPSDKLDRSS